MEITQEKKGALNSLLRINVSQEDYQNKLDDALKDLGKKMTLKGFRPGMVPKGVVRKMYGNQVLAEELNKIVSGELNNYIKEKELQILGEPLPNEDERVVVDINKPSDYAFTYELGLSPEISLTMLEAKEAVTELKIQVEPKLVDDEIARMRKQFGKRSTPDEAGEEDILYLRLTALNADGKPVEGAMEKDTVLAFDQFKDKDLIGKIKGIKIGQEFEIEDLPAALEKTVEEVATNVLQLQGEEKDAAPVHFRAEVTGLTRVEPCEVDKEFFDRAFGPDKIENEQAMRDFIEGEIQIQYDKQTDRVFRDQLIKKFITETPLELPEAFLKRWLKLTRKEEGEMTEEEYEHFTRNLRWSLIFGKIAKDNELKVEKEELEGEVRRMISSQFGAAAAQMGEAEISGLVGRFMQNEEYLSRTYDQLLEDKVFGVVRNQLEITEQKLSTEDYQKRITEETK